jgi:polysaccharide deacetylase 2 family uncharacterized protein YibQ
LRLPRVVRRTGRRLRRRLRPRNLAVAAALIASLAVTALSLSTPPMRSHAHRTDPVLRALGLPPEEVTAPDPVPMLAASPRFVLPLLRRDEKRVLVFQRPAPPPSPAVAVVAPPPAAPPRVVPRPEPAPTRLAAAVVTLPVPPKAPPTRTADPVLAIVIDDLGPAQALTRRAVHLPRPVTLAFLPYAEGLDAFATAAKANGHEVYLHLPMEPEGEEDPGPNAILVGLEPGELSRRLAWALDRLPQATGVNNHMGSRATSDPAAMLEVLQEVRRRGLAFVDSRTSPLSVGNALAERLGLPHAARDVFLDNDPSPAAIRRRLDEALRLARRRGHALAIGHPYPTTLAVLEDWLPRAEARGVRPVRAADLIARQRCRPATIPVSACAGGGCPPAPDC